MCIRDRGMIIALIGQKGGIGKSTTAVGLAALGVSRGKRVPVSYTHLRAHETVLDLVCRLLLEKKKKKHP